MSALTRQAPPRQIVESYPAVPASVARARRELGQFALVAGLEEARADAVRLAVSEAVTNVVRHAYGRASGVVHIRAGVERGELWVRIADDGHGIDVPSHSPGLGVGLSLIAAVSDAVSVLARRGGGTELRMGFDLEA